MLVVIIILTILLIIMSYKYLSLRYDILKITKQLDDLSNELSSNQYIRTETQTYITKKMNTSLNRILDEIKNERKNHKKKELMLNQEITNISHDLRTPLTAIKGYADILGEANDKNEMKDYVKVISSKASTLITTVDLFHEITRLNSFDYKIKIEELSIDQLIKDNFLPYFKEFEKKGIEVFFSERKVSNILADKSAVERIVNNLIQNILRYGKSVVDIDFSENEEEVFIYLSNDTEENLKSGKQKILFERTHTNDNSRFKGKTGLGLYIVKRLVERQNGNVQAFYKNSTFIVQIKLKKVVENKKE
ncbi:sensor histidine kinase [Staphylococcus caprae]|uniref:sensor histidine kinase n=2 Tax=Staphylococcus caprae TaxID=29380 RepID=UPI000E68AEE5|nr:HAMP domain-containing sensor histidine kinase [Staphylococcus caprae]MDK6298234.1 HAMP domain-containing sensor histidine kinase [Staphylococcus caprae]MDK7232312.1 HAMP domain-containing sensor histidine kinase [Staphylococcus caprae]RIM35340.1 sensor histidine kinase [Staphylococcus caprae]